MTTTTTPQLPQFQLQDLPDNTAAVPPRFGRGLETVSDIVGEPQLSSQSDEADHDRTPSTKYHLPHEHANANAAKQQQDAVGVEGGLAAVAARPGKIELHKVTIPVLPVDNAPVGVASSKADGGAWIWGVIGGSGSIRID